MGIFCRISHLGYYNLTVTILYNFIKQLMFLGGNANMSQFAATINSQLILMQIKKTCDGYHHNVVIFLLSLTNPFIFHFYQKGRNTTIDNIPYIAVNRLWTAASDSPKSATSVEGVAPMAVPSLDFLIYMLILPVLGGKWYPISGIWRCRVPGLLA